MFATTESIVYTWGTSADERAQPFPCDQYLPDAEEAYFRGVDVRAPVEVLFRWLCQLRAAPYSYDWIDNWGRRSPRRLTPGLERLAVGQRMMSIFELVEFEPDRHLTVVIVDPGAKALFGAVVGSYAVVPRAGGGCRLIVKLLVRYPRNHWAWIRWVLPWGDLIMMRKQLLNLKYLAERTRAF